MCCNIADDSFRGQETSSQDKSSGISTGAAAGIGVGATVGVVAVGLAGYHLAKGKVQQCCDSNVVMFDILMMSSC